MTDKPSMPLCAFFGITPFLLILGGVYQQQWDLRRAERLTEPPPVVLWKQADPIGDLIGEIEEARQRGEDWLEQPARLLAAGYRVNAAGKYVR